MHGDVYKRQVVNGRVVGRNELVGAVVTKVEIARRHLIGRGAESPQTTGIAAYYASDDSYQGVLADTYESAGKK